MACPARTSERNQLVVAHLRNVKTAARRLKVSASLRDDLVSAGNEALVRAGDRFDPSAKVAFTTFAFRAVLGSMLDALRSQSKWSARHVAIDSDEVAVPASAERQLLAAQVLAALASLPGLPQTLIRAHYLEEETLSAIATRLGMSKTTVSNQLGQALRLLRAKLDDDLATWPVSRPAAKRRRSEQFKHSVLLRACRPGTNVAQLARELDIPSATIHTWLRPWRDGAKVSLPLAA